MRRRRRRSRKFARQTTTNWPLLSAWNLVQLVQLWPAQLCLSISMLPPLWAHNSHCLKRASPKGESENRKENKDGASAFAWPPHTRLETETDAKTETESESYANALISHSTGTALPLPPSFHCSTCFGTPLFGARPTAKRKQRAESSKRQTANRQQVERANNKRRRREQH